MPDVKKLITGFLILAGATATSAAILSSVNIGNSGEPAPVAAVAAAPASAPSVPDNAFVDNSQPQNAAIAGVVASSTDSADGDPSNVTENLADAFASGVVESNPTVPQSASAGNVQLADPDPQTMAEALLNEPAVASMTLPDWDNESNLLQNEMKIVQDSTDTLVTYLNAFAKINNERLVQSGLLDTVKNEVNANNEEDASVLPRAGSAVVDMLGAAIALPTPASLVDFQKSFIKLLVYENAVSSLEQNTSDDPGKAALVLQYKQSDYDQAVQNFSDQSQVLNKFITEKPPQSKESGLLSLMQDLFLPGIANAQVFVPVIDPTAKAAIAAAAAENDEHGWAVFFEQLGRNIGIQILKNTLMLLVQKKVLKWIQGSGAPRFVQQWGTMAVNAFTTAAINKLNQSMACIAPVQAGSLKILFATPNASAQGNFCANTFNSFLRAPNFQQLSTHFTNFNDYFGLLQPGNNMWSNIITLQDQARAAGANNQSAVQLKSVAGQGMTGSQACSDGSNPNGIDTVCESQGAGTGPTGAKPPCPAGQVAVQIQNNGQCSNGTEPAVTMPAIVTGQSLQTAIGASTLNTATANEIAGIIDALASSLLTSITQEVIGAVTKDINGVLTAGSSGGLLTISASSTVPLDINVPSSTTASTSGSGVQCDTLQTTGSLDLTTGLATVSLYAQGGALDINAISSGTGDGEPIYTWSAPGAVGTITGTTTVSTPFTVTYNAAGVYHAAVTASTDNSVASCEVDISTATSTTP